MRRLLLGLLLVFSLIGCSGGGDTSTTQVETTAGSVVQTLFTSACVPVDAVHYDSQNELGSYFNDIEDFTMYWDNRYTAYQAATACTPNLVASTIVDTRTNGEPIHFGGPQSTLIHRFKDAPYPWVGGANLMLQASFSSISYENFGGNLGGNIAYNLFIVNRHTNHRLNYVISTHNFGSAVKQENPNILYDTSTSTAFVSTTIAEGTQYVTKSSTTPFRVNISSNNLTRALQGMGEVNINVGDWYVLFIGIQFELEEEGGDGRLSGAFSGFESYITSQPM